MWSLTLPQVAATLASAIVPFKTSNAGLGPLMTEHYAPLLVLGYKKKTSDRMAAYPLDER
jgi:hypothetical protein